MQTINLSNNQHFQFYNNADRGESGASQDTNPATVQGRDPSTGAGPAGGNSRLWPKLPGVQALSNQIQRVQTDVNAVGASVGGLSTKLDSVQGDVTNILGKFGKVDKDIGQINKNLSTVQNQTSQNTSDLSAIKTSLGTLQPVIANIDREVAALKSCCGSNP
jgi:TolA-binding protein